MVPYIWLSISGLEDGWKLQETWETGVSNANIIKERKKLHRNFPRDWGSNQTSFRGSKVLYTRYFPEPNGTCSVQSHCLICPADCVVRYLH